MNYKRVNSAVDLWLTLLLAFAAALISFTLINYPKEDGPIGYFIGIPVLIFILWIYFGTWYELREDHLYCQSGPIRQRIKYDNIKSLKLSNNPLSSLALSIKRIEIREHNKGFMLGTTFISPKNREEFLEELKKRCHNLEEF